MFGRRTTGLSPSQGSAYSLIFAAGARSYVLRLSNKGVVAALAVLLLILSLYLGATAYWIFHDELIAAITRHQIDMQYAYEDRIAFLRSDIEKMTLRARSEEAHFTAELQNLTMRQIEAESRTALLLTLSDRLKTYRLNEPNSAEDQAHAAVARSRAEAERNPLLDGAFASPLPAPLPEAARAFAPMPAPPLVRKTAKPHPEAPDLRLGSETDKDVKDSDPAPPKSSKFSPRESEADMPLTIRIARLARAYQTLDEDHLHILANMQAPIAHFSANVHRALAVAGLTGERFTDFAAVHELPRKSKENTNFAGGPFVPLPSDKDKSAFALEAAALQATVLKAENLRMALAHLPFRRPLQGVAEVTSGFGARIDPFLGRPALHTGIDLREDYGAPVRATAAGIVVSAGPDGGYGNMVEIDHGNGLTTRYAHLSAIVVSADQKVEIGTILGRLGSTGRSTGPHLHYETRIDGEPVDPERFLKAGSLLFDQPDRIFLTHARVDAQTE